MGNIRKNGKKVKGEISFKELVNGEKELCKLEQQLTYFEEIRALRKNDLIYKCSPIYSLSPGLNEDGLLVVHGRLSNASIPGRQRPI